jgi:hypothetical protein
VISVASYQTLARGSPLYEQMRDEELNHSFSQCIKGRQSNTATAAKVKNVIKSLATGYSTGAAMMNALAWARKLSDGGNPLHARRQVAKASEGQAPSVQIKSVTSPLRTRSQRSWMSDWQDARNCVYCCSRVWPAALADAVTVYCLSRVARDDLPQPIYSGPRRS